MIEPDQTAAQVEVFFVNTVDGWATAEFDQSGNQIGEAVMSYRKTWAIREARAMAGGCIPIKVFSRAGEHLKTLNAATIEDETQ